MLVGGRLRGSAVAAVAAVAAAMLALAACAVPAAAHGLRGYEVAQPLTLSVGQAGTFTLACRMGDVAVDGTWHVETAASGASINLVSALDVLEADSFSRQGYRFRVRNNIASALRLRLFVSCLDGDVSGARLRVLPRRTRRASIVGPGSARVPNLRCPDHTVAIAPGFDIPGHAGLARVVMRYPALPSLAASRLGLVALSAVDVEASTRCLSLRTTRHRGVRRRLHVAFRAADTTLGDGRVEAYTVSCRAGERAIIGAFRLSEAYYLGQALEGRSRGFRLQSPASGAPGRARLGLLCLRMRASIVR